MSFIRTLATGSTTRSHYKPKQSQIFPKTMSVSFEMDYDSPQGTRILKTLETVLDRLNKLEKRVSTLENHH